MITTKDLPPICPHVPLSAKNCNTKEDTLKITDRNKPSKRKLELKAARKRSANEARQHRKRLRELTNLLQTIEVKGLNCRTLQLADRRLPRSLYAWTREVHFVEVHRAEVCVCEVRVGERAAEVRIR